MSSNWASFCKNLRGKCNAQDLPNLLFRIVLQNPCATVFQYSIWRRPWQPKMEKTSIEKQGTKSELESYKSHGLEAPKSCKMELKCPRMIKEQLTIEFLKGFDTKHRGIDMKMQKMGSNPSFHGGSSRTFSSKVGQCKWWEEIGISFSFVLGFPNALILIWDFYHIHLKIKYQTNMLTMTLHFIPTLGAFEFDLI